MIYGDKPDFLLARIGNMAHDSHDSTSEPCEAWLRPVINPISSVRARLHKILAEARAAEKLPWGPARVSLYRTIFPQMTNWLPEDEGAQLRFEFEAEMARLKAA